MSTFEPMLVRDRNRFHFRITDVELREAYVNALAKFWTPAEVQPSADKSQWDALNPDVQAFLALTLAFFASSDGVVFENCAMNFGDEVTIPEARFFYSLQGFMENVHSETYMKILTTYVTDDVEQDRLIHSIQTVPVIAAKANWTMRHFDQSIPFARRLVAFACVEGIFFSSAFASIFWFKHHFPGQLHALTFSNQLIARDEGLHVEFAVLLFHRLQKKPTFDEVRAIIEEAVKLESDFVEEALKVDLIGIKSDDMIAYIQFVADRLMQQLGFESIYAAKNPFQFMELQSMRIQQNFFEGKVADYSATDGAFSETAAF